MQQRVYLALRTNIISGRFPPGRPVTLRGLAQEMGVSLTPVREALRRLVAERALDLLDNRRVRVPPMTPERFKDLLAARIALEGEAAERAMESVDDARIDRMERIDRELDVARAAGDAEKWIAANFAFHETLYTARDSAVFMPLVESLWLQIGPFMRLALGSLEDRYIVDRHEEALAALRRRDASGLRRAIEADIREGIGHLGLLTRMPATSV